MRDGTSRNPITLSADDRATLTYLTHELGEGHLLKARAMIVIACAESGSTISGIARKLGISRPTVTLWRNRFMQRGLEGLISAEDVDGGYAAHHWKSIQYCERDAILKSSHGQNGAD